MFFVVIQSPAIVSFVAQRRRRIVGLIQVRHRGAFVVWFISKARRASAGIAKFLDLNPIAPICVGLLVGVTLSLRSHSLVTTSGALFICLISIFPFMLLLVGEPRSAMKHTLKAFVCVALGVCSAEFALFHPEDHYANLADGGDVGAEIAVVVTDPTATGETVPWLSPPRLLKCEVVESRISRSESWRRTTGRVFVRLPRESPSVAYGDAIVLSGAFIKPAAPPFAGAFDFGRYLVSRGAPMLFQADTVSASDLRDSSDWSTRVMRSVLSFRNRVLLALTNGMALDDKRTLAALMFGCRQGVSYADRQTYLRSGVIHIFAISGLHVGMLAMTLFLLLRWVPFRIRYALAPLFLLLYTVSTGMQASATRALLMIGAWSLMRAFLHKTSALNVIFLAASAIILFTPLSVMGAGFQYSFTIAAFLVVSWRSVEKWQSMMRERHLWLPAGTITFRSAMAAKTVDRVFNAFSTTIVAWLAGTSLTLLYRSYFIPGAAFTNLLVVPVVWLLFATASIQFVLLPLRGLFSLSPVMEGLLHVIKSAGSIGADVGGGFHLSTPPLWSVAIFMLSFLVLLVAKRRFACGVALASMLCVALFWLSSPYSTPEAIVLVNGGDSDQPAVVHLAGGLANGATVVNPGSKERCRAILAFLASRGENVVERMLFTANRKPRLGGASMLLAGMTVRHIIFPAGFRRSRFAKFAMNRARANGTHVTILPSASTETDAAAYSSPTFSFIGKEGEGAEMAWRSPCSDSSVDLRPTFPGEMSVDVKFANSADFETKKFMISNAVSFDVNFSRF